MSKISEFLDSQEPNQEEQTRNRVKNPSEKPAEEIRISPRTGKPIQKSQSRVDYTKKPLRRTKKKMKPRGGNSPVIGMNGYNLEPGDNTKITMVSIKLFNLPAIDLRDPEQVAARLDEFFRIYAEADMKPAVAGMAMALNGMSRTTLLGIANDRPTGGGGYHTALPTSVTGIIKKAYKIMETSWENYLTSGKLNPVTGISWRRTTLATKIRQNTCLHRTRPITAK